MKSSRGNQGNVVEYPITKQLLPINKKSVANSLIGATHA